MKYFMAKKAKSSRRVRSTFTNNKGQRVTSFSDGTKSVVGEARNVPKVGSTVDGKRVGYTVGGQAFESGSDPEAGRGPITSESLKQPKQINVPQEVTTPVPDVAANNTGLVNQEMGITTKGNGLEVDAPEKFGGVSQTADFYNRQLEELTGEAPSAASVQRKLERETGLREKQQEVSNYAGQLNTIVANRDANILRVEGQGRGIPEAIIGGQQAQINKEAAIAALPVQAQLATAQGNLQLAQDHINTWGNILMTDATNKYNRKKELLTSARDFAVGIEFKRLEELEKKNDREFQERKELTKVKTQSISNALGQGAPASVVNAIKSATTLEDAVAAAGIYNGDVLGRQIKQAQLRTENLQQARILQELNPTADPGVSSDIVSYAQQFADTGKLPSVSELKNSGISVAQVTEYAKQVPKSNGALLSRSTGVKSSALSSTQEDGILALRDISEKVKQLKELDNKRQKGLISAAVGKVFGSDDQQRYIDLRGEIVDLLARARTGAALTVQEENFYAGQLPGRIGQVGVVPGTGAGLFGVNSQERINNFESKITGTLDTKLNGQGLVIQGYSKVDIPSLGKRTVGEIVEIGGEQYRVLPDGTLTDII